MYDLQNVDLAGYTHWVLNLYFMYNLMLRNIYITTRVATCTLLVLVYIGIL